MKRLMLFSLVLLVAGCAGHLSAPRQSVVFFQTDDATLTPEGQQVVAQLASDAKSLHPSRVVIEGRANGGTPHDATLADQRAAEVTHALVEAGVHADTMQK